MSKRVALVTNVREYAGLPAALALADEGWIVVCHDRAFNDADTLAAFAIDHPKLFATAEQEPQSLVDTVTAEHKQVDVVISNDSFPAIRAPIEDASLEDYRATIEALLVSPFALIKAVAPQMKARRSGRIILMTSAAPLRPYPGYTMYTSARGGASALAIALAKELAAFNIQVNAIAPNFLQSETYFPAELWEKDPKFRKRVEDLVPLQRLGRPAEIGALIAFLASGKADFITGQIIPFTGGWP